MFKLYIIGPLKFASRDCFPDKVHYSLNSTLHEIKNTAYTYRTETKISRHSRPVLKLAYSNIDKHSKVNSYFKHDKF